MSKLDLTVIFVAVAAGALLIEQGHRIVIEAPAAEVIASAAAGCSDNDTVPYSVECLEFLKVPLEPPARLQMTAGVVEPRPCPDSDKVPYSASCLAFLKGATETGMRWRMIETPVPPLQ